MKQTSTYTLALLSLPVLCIACGHEEPSTPAPPAQESESDQVPVQANPLPDSVEIASPSDPIRQLEAVEDATEEVADSLLDFSDKFRRRDWTACSEWLMDDFLGEGLHGLPVKNSQEEHLNVEVLIHDAQAANVLDKDGFLGNLTDLVGSWERVESTIWKTKAAEFERGRGQRWGRVKLYVHMTGVASQGGGVGVTAWGYAKAVKDEGRWKLAAFDLTSLEVTQKRTAIFTEVSAAAGVAHTWPRFGTPENFCFAFNGAASGDVNGDGRWDLFVPSDGHNFLYIGQADGTFKETAQAAGVWGPEGGTGALFLDYDNDGDQDLVVGHADDATGGARMCLYQGDGKGQFVQVEGALGMADVSLSAYSLTAFDFDNDGWLDIFACGYGELDKEHNNSWVEATNGYPNALFRNEQGQRFTDVSEAAGVRGTSWSYAAAAADIDRDGDLDLYVANDYGSNCYYENQGDGTFTNQAGPFGITDQGNGMAAAFGDFSGDGNLDLYVSNMSSTAGNRILDRYKEDVPDELYAILKKSAAGNTIFTRTDPGGFTALPKSAGGVGANWAWSPALADFDLDGHLDVFCTNGFVTGTLAHDT